MRMNMKKKGSYKQQYQEAKAAYMDRKDYAIGRGFSQSPEYRAVRRREVSFNYRQRKKEALTQAEKINPEKPKTGEVVRNIDENLFFLALSREWGSSAPEGIFEEVKEAAKEQGKRGVGVVESKLPGFDDKTGKPFAFTITCYSEFDYQKALRELFRVCGKFQSQDGGNSSAAPTVVSSIVEKDNLIVAYTYAVAP